MPDNHKKIDWANGCINFEQSERNLEKKEVSIIFVGDLSSTGSFQTPMAEGIADSIYGNALNILLSADYRIFNLETVLSKKGAPIAKSGANLSASPEILRGGSS